MKKFLLAATVLVGGMAFAQAGFNINIGFGLPLPRPGIVIRQPAYVCPPPVYIAPPRCPPPVYVAPCPPVQYHPNYWHGGSKRWRGHSAWNHDDRGNGHRR